MISLILKETQRVGVNFLHIEKKDNECDSIREQTINQSGKVILIEEFENEKHIQSNQKFLETVTLSGLTVCKYN